MAFLALVQVSFLFFVLLRNFFRRSTQSSSFGSFYLFTTRAWSPFRFLFNLVARRRIFKMCKSSSPPVHHSARISKPFSSHLKQFEPSNKKIFYIAAGAMSRYNNNKSSKHIIYSIYIKRNYDPAHPSLRIYKRKYIK